MPQSVINLMFFTLIGTLRSRKWNKATTRFLNLLAPHSSSFFRESTPWTHDVDVIRDLPVLLALDAGHVDDDGGGSQLLAAGFPAPLPLSCIP